MNLPFCGATPEASEADQILPPLPESPTAALSLDLCGVFLASGCLLPTLGERKRERERERERERGKTRSEYQVTRRGAEMRGSAQ